jgi:hypothetical protein
VTTSFVKQFLEFTKEYESPTSFFKWAAYSAVGAVLRDNVYMAEGYRIITPNIYVLLLAQSAMHRKSVPVGLVGDLVSEIRNTKIIRGRTSIQAVLDDLSGIITDRESGTPIRGGSCLLCAEELASFIVQSPEAVPILTDIYDFRKEWTSSLRGAGKFKISNLCVTMCAASNEVLLKEVYTDLAIGGGLLGRTFFVKPDEFRKGNSLLKKEVEKYDTKILINSLRDISKLKGEILFDDGAQAEYDRWYDAWRMLCQDKADKSGVMGRIHTGIKKIAAILAISNRNELVVRRQDVEESIEECLKLLPNYESFISAQGKSSEAEAASILIDVLKSEKTHRIDRKDFLYAHYMDVSAEMLEKILKTFEGAGIVQRVIGDKGEEIRLTQKALDKWKMKEKGVGNV